MAGIKNFEDSTGVFAGQGDLGIFDTPEDYATASFAGLANPRSLGQIVQDSTEWEGEDPETTTVKDEQGDIITARVVAGTLGFSFDLASTSLKMVAKFLGGEEILASVLGTNENFDGAVEAVGFGVDLPVFTAPIFILNDDLTRIWLYPKSKIVGNLTWSDGLWRIHATVTCEYLNTPSLKTGMILNLKNKMKYDTAVTEP